MAKKVLITGINGFVGRHLADYILKAHGNILIYGIEKAKEGQKVKRRENIGNESHKNGIKVFRCDIADRGQLEGLVKKIRPEIIFHLAARISVSESWKEPGEYFETNAIGTINLLEAVRKFCPAAAILIPGSSDEYASINSKISFPSNFDLPAQVFILPKFMTAKQNFRGQRIPKLVRKIDENWPLWLRNPYALTKMCQEILGWQYWKNYGLKIILVRTFNITGPGQSDLAVCSSFAKQIATAEFLNRESVVRVGDLEIVRDFTDVRDVVRAYWLAVKKCNPGEIYNICSGKGRKISDILKKFLSISTGKIIIRKDRGLFRKSEAVVLIGDSRKFRKQTGWEPQLDILEKTLPEMLEWWRDKIARR